MFLKVSWIFFKKLFGGAFALCFLRYHQILVRIVCSHCADHAGSPAGSCCQRRKKKTRGVSAAAPAAVSKSKSAGCEATVSHGTPAHRSFCLASTLRGSVSVPHPSLFALLHCTVSDQPVRKPSSHGCLSWAFIVRGVGPQSSLNIAKGLCLLLFY